MIFYCNPYAIYGDLYKDILNCVVKETPIFRPKHRKLKGYQKRK